MEDEILEIAIRTEPPPQPIAAAAPAPGPRRRARASGVSAPPPAEAAPPLSPPAVYETLVRPLVAELNEDAAKVTRLTMADLAGAPRWPTVGSKLLSWLAQHCEAEGGRGATPVFIGHNVQK